MSDITVGCMESFEEYVERSETTFRESRHQRRGQAFFNVLREWRPDLASDPEVRRTSPFYSDGMLPAFLEVVGSRWYG